MRNRSLITVVLLLAACSSARSTSQPTTSAGDTTTVTSTVASSTSDDTTVTTSAPSTTTPSTAGPTTSSATTDATTVPSTAAPCSVAGDTNAKGTGDPLTLSSLVGSDIRTGGHACFERVVIELQGTGGFPGWGVAWVDDPQRLGESDEFVNIDGAATLLVRMGMWMPDMGGVGYAGPTDIHPTNVRHIRELRNTENFEGMSIWAIGVDAEYPFTVQVLHSPERLVIDIQTGP